MYRDSKYMSRKIENTVLIINLVYFRKLSLAFNLEYLSQFFINQESMTVLKSTWQEDSKTAPDLWIWWRIQRYSWLKARLNFQKYTIPNLWSWLYKNALYLIIDLSGRGSYGMIIIMVRENLSFPCMCFMKTILEVMMARG